MRLRLHSAGSTLPHLWPTGSSEMTPSTTARQFSSCPSDSTSRWTPCPPALKENRPARHYPRFWIWRPSSGRQRDFNPPDQCAAQRTLCPRLTSVRPSHRLMTEVALRQTNRSPRVLRTGFPPTYPSHLHTPLPDGYLASGFYPPLPRSVCLLCASCTSGREFAYRFLQTPPRGGSPCGSANGSRHQGP